MDYALADFKCLVSRRHKKGVAQRDYRERARKKKKNLDNSNNNNKRRQGRGEGEGTKIRRGE